MTPSRRRHKNFPCYARLFAYRERLNSCKIERSNVSTTARRLMDAVTALGRERNCGYLLWSVFKPNTMARKFYDGIGGQETADLDWMTLKL